VTNLPLLHCLENEKLVCFTSSFIKTENKTQLQSLMIVYLPLMISGAKYSWVPTKDIERAPVGSAMSSGRAVI
jgi:hypothetical protein